MTRSPAELRYPPLLRRILLEWFGHLHAIQLVWLVLDFVGSVFGWIFDPNARTVRSWVTTVAPSTAVSRPMKSVIWLFFDCLYEQMALELQSTEFCQFLSSSGTISNVPPCPYERICLAMALKFKYRWNSSGPETPAQYRASESGSVPCSRKSTFEPLITALKDAACGDESNETVI